jgi:hypothetical protein
MSVDLLFGVCIGLALGWLLRSWVERPKLQVLEEWRMSGQGFKPTPQPPNDHM